MIDTHSRRAAAALAVAFVLGAWPAASQAAAQSLQLRITPRAGAMTPADWFYEEFEHFGVEPLEWTEAALLRAPVIGLSAELAVMDDALWIRGEILRTVGQELSITHAFLRPPSGFDPPRVLRTPFTLDAAVTTATLDVALPTRFRLPLGLQPYVTAGVGGKRYDFDVAPVLSHDDQIVLPQEGTTWLVNVGAGLTARVAGLQLDLLVRDALSEYWENQQHDVIVLLGLTVPVLTRP